MSAIPWAVARQHSVIATEHTLHAKWSEFFISWTLRKLWPGNAADRFRWLSQEDKFYNIRVKNTSHVEDALHDRIA